MTTEPNRSPSRSDASDGSDAASGAASTAQGASERPSVANAAEHILTAIVEASQDSIVTVDCGGVVTIWNRRAERFFGPAADEAIGRPLTDLKLTGDAAPLLRNVERVNGTQKPERFDNVRVRRSGRERVLQVQMSPVQDEAGQAFGVLVIARDVTEQAMAAETARQTETRQTYLLALSDAIGPMASAEAIKAEAARVLGRYLGVASAGYVEVEADGDTAYVAGEYNDGRLPPLPERYQLRDYGIFAEVVLGGQELFLEDYIVDPRLTAEVQEAAKPLAVRAVVAIPLVKEGRVVAFLSAVAPEPRSWSELDRDILRETAERTWAAVERARTEAALRESKSRLSAIFAEAAVGLSELDLEGRFLQVNDELCRILGRSREDLLRIGVVDVTHPDDLPASFAAVSDAIATRRTVAIDKRYMRPSGEMVLANSRITVLPDRRDGPGSLLVVTVELTAR